MQAKLQKELKETKFPMRFKYLERQAAKADEYFFGKVTVTVLLQHLGCTDEFTHLAIGIASLAWPDCIPPFARAFFLLQMEEFGQAKAD